jgi:acid phosphatase (class A)
MRSTAPAALLLTAAAVIAAPGIISAQAGQRPPAPAARYLSAAETPDLARITPPAPVAGDARDVLDLSIFRTTRALQGSPRWDLALADNDISVPALLKDFSCAAGMTLSAATTPQLSALVSRMSRDAIAGFTVVKNANPDRKRPFLSAPGPVCLANTGNLASNPDYPSGHTVVGWSVALVSAELMPDHATGILIRGRAFGESRVVCGVHNASAVDSGHIVAESIVTALRGNAAFRSDLEAARTELMAARAARTPAPTAACTAEGEMVARRPY